MRGRGQHHCKGAATETGTPTLAQAGVHQEREPLNVKNFRWLFEGARNWARRSGRCTPSGVQRPGRFAGAAPLGPAPDIRDQPARATGDTLVVSISCVLGKTVNCPPGASAVGLNRYTLLRKCRLSNPIGVVP